MFLFIMKSRVLFARLSVLSLACAAAFPVLAQTETTMPETVVTATRVAQPLTDVLADVSVIDREELEQSGLESLAQVLARLPGVQHAPSGSYRSTTGLFLRGASTAQTILLVNGVRVGSATSGQYSLENLPLDRIERVEVLRGAAAALYGPDAVGGVIQVFTREPVNGLQRSASIGLGTDGQLKAGASLQGKSGAFGYTLGLSHERATGINVKTPGASGFNADEDGYEFTSLDAGLRWRLGERHSLGMNLLASEGTYDFDGAPFPAPSGVNAGNTDAVSEPSLRQVTVDWKAQWTSAWLSTLTAGRTQDRSPSRYWRQSNGDFISESRFDTTRHQLIWQNDIRLGADMLTVAADLRRDEIESSLVFPVSERKMRGLLASYAKRSDHWDALLTLRHDRNSQFGSVNTWSLSGGYKLDDVWRLVGSAGTTFQAPSFNQLYYPGFGNPLLRPQEGRAHEIGLRYSRAGTRAGVVAYQNEIEGFINPATNVQSSRAVLKGVTFSWDQTWGATTLSASYDYANPVLKPSNARVSRVARNLLQAQLDHRLGAWKPFAELRLSGDRFDSPTGVTLPGYGVLNIGTTYQLDRNWKVIARLNNAGDKTYSLANGFTMPGRNLFVSLNWND